MARVSRSPPTIADVRTIALAMASTVERPSYGTPGFRVQDRLFARVLDEQTIVVKVDPAWRDSLVAGSPDVFHVTPHYEPYPWVIVRLPAVDRASLREILAAAYEFEAASTGKRIRKKTSASRRS
jgi:hypothetical protein